jgi:hypothetical protein
MAQPGRHKEPKRPGTTYQEDDDEDEDDDDDDDDRYCSDGHTFNYRIF